MFRPFKQIRLSFFLEHLRDDGIPLDPAFRCFPPGRNSLVPAIHLFRGDYPFGKQKEAPDFTYGLIESPVSNATRYFFELHCDITNMLAISRVGRKSSEF